MKRKPRRISIQLKLNALVIGSILAVDVEKDDVKVTFPAVLFTAIFLRPLIADVISSSLYVPAVAELLGKSLVVPFITDTTHS